MGAGFEAGVGIVGLKNDCYVSYSKLTHCSLIKLFQPIYWTSPFAILGCQTESFSNIHLEKWLYILQTVEIFIRCCILSLHCLPKYPF